MRYFLGFIAAVALVILVFILIVRGFSGREHAPQTMLTDYSKTETVMRFTEEGPVNIDQNHRSLSVTVGRSSNIINLMQGYQGTVIRTQTYPSNEEGYATFLRALQLQGYDKGNSDPAKQDSRGFCPTGRVYTFEIVTGSATVQSFWTTSCGGGTFRGNSTIIRQLFRAQAPDYTKFITGTDLN